MDQERLIDQLVQLGLSASEAKVFFAGWCLGSSTGNEIVLRAKLSRTAVYQALVELEKQGLTVCGEKDGKRFYQMIDPDRLLQIAQERHETKMIHFRSCLAELRSRNASQQPVYSCDEGVEAIFRAFREVAQNPPAELLTLSNHRILHDNVTSATIKEALKLVPNRERIRVRALHSGVLKTYNTNDEHYELPDDLLEVAGEFWIYNDTTVYLSYTDSIRVVTHRVPAFTHNMRIFFEGLWRYTKLHHQMKACHPPTSL